MVQTDSKLIVWGPYHAFADAGVLFRGPLLCAEGGPTWLQMAHHGIFTALDSALRFCLLNEWTNPLASEESCYSAFFKQLHRWMFKQRAQLNIWNVSCHQGCVSLPLQCCCTWRLATSSTGLTRKLFKCLEFISLTVAVFSILLGDSIQHRQWSCSCKPSCLTGSASIRGKS